MFLKHRQLTEAQKAQHPSPVHEDHEFDIWGDSSGSHYLISVDGEKKCFPDRYAAWKHATDAMAQPADEARE